MEPDDGARGLLTMGRVPRRRSRDNGFAVVLVALTLIVMLVFTAFAVDLGAVYSARRNDQNAADVGALAGTAALIEGGTPNDAIQAVRDRVNETLFDDPSEYFTAAEWNSCVTKGLAFPPSFTVMSHSVDGSQDCIRRDGDRVYVRVPERSVETAFGAVVGVDNLEHTAFAIAGPSRDGFGNVLPFAFLAGADTYACLKDAPGGLSIEPCNGPETGNFNYLDFTYFGDSAVGTTETCTGQETSRLSNNIAAGIDHDLSKYPPANISVVDRDECEAPEGSEDDPNTLSTATGNKQSSFGEGIYSGSSFTDGQPARLQRQHSDLFGGGGQTESVAGHTLDDNPLWAFLPDSFPTGASVPPSCNKSIFDEVLVNNYTNLPDPGSGVDVRSFIEGQAANPSNPTDAEKALQMRWLLNRCFEHYAGRPFDGDGSIGPDVENSPCPTSGCTAPVFTRDTLLTDEFVDIQLTSRFGYVPQLVESAFPTPGTVHVATFRAVFMQQLLGRCSGNECDIDFEPGPFDAAEDPGGTETDAHAITAFVFPFSMLPNGLAGEDAPFELGVNRFVRLIR